MVEAGSVVLTRSVTREAQWNRMWVTTSEARSPAPNRATPLSGAAIRSRNGMRHPWRLIVGTATAVTLRTMTHPDRTR